MAIKRIGVLTGGGDCPGLNAVIRSVAKAAIYRYGVRVFGIEDGFQGLIEDRVGELMSLHVSGILTRGGTILGTNNRADPARYYVGDDADGEPIFENVVDRCVATVDKHQLDALIVIGGDGTMACAAPFIDAGINCIGVPKTIDNDIVGTDISFGFTTAYTTATLSLDRLHSTAASHHRVMVCELMGRNAGWLTLHAGLASGSDVILLPEIPFDLDAVSKFVESRTQRGRGFSIIACAEGAAVKGEDQVVAFHVGQSHHTARLGGIGEHVAQAIAERTGLETRTTVLGHVQRGGPPVPADRVLATQFGYHALGILMDGAKSRMVTSCGDRIGDTGLMTAVGSQRLVPRDHPLIDIARSVRTSFGE
ncbi:MAG: 6-phosphofructokinase [Planctomycetes bacterium]|nr:6-phosphofructokinase [Planctomycetota bacterium]